MLNEFCKTIIKHSTRITFFLASIAGGSTVATCFKA